MPRAKIQERKLKRGASKNVSNDFNDPTESPDKRIASPELQQWVLNIFKVGCRGAFDDSLSSTIQEIKHHLFERDFASAFGKPEYLEVYAARWSPTRALCYLEILLDQRAIIDRLSGSLKTVLDDHDLAQSGQELFIDDASLPRAKTTLSQPESLEFKNLQKQEKIICLGAGGGAELAAFTGFLHHLADTLIQDNRQGNPVKGHCLDHSQDFPPRNASDTPFDCAFIDIADWTEVLTRLYSGASTIGPMHLSDSPLDQHVDGNIIAPVPFRFSAEQQDVLEVTQDQWGDKLGDASLITIMFTLNELYSTSLGSTTKLLLHLTSIMEPGALLLVVDSPGSYSTVKIRDYSQADHDSVVSTEGRPSEKRYPMQWLLDHTLLESATTSDSENNSHKKWTKLVSEDSKWFRLPRMHKLKYPLELEDMRYQMHLYQRI